MRSIVSLKSDNLETAANTKNNMLTVTLSNQLETLLDIFLERADQLSASPFVAEEIVVPSAGIRRKLELAIADRRGICANVSFSFFGSWVVEQSVPDASASPFSADVLSWQIFKILSNEAFVSQHVRLSSWLSKTHDDTMRFDLAQRIAPLLEQYALYRPEWLHAWTKGENAFSTETGATEEQNHAWQAALWRRIIKENQSTHPWIEMHEWLSSSRAASASGSVAHIFCPPSIAPLYIDALQRLGQSKSIHLYLLNPCCEFWFDVVDSRRLNYLKAKDQVDYHETGNSLLAAWGKQAQSMLNLLFSNHDLSSHESSSFSANSESIQSPSILSEIQDAILELRELNDTPLPFNEGDRSLEIHVCHSLARELEVLQDQLLAAFANDRTLKPEEVLVVTPDLELATPLIDAIFGTAQNERRIPYAVSGRKGSRDNPSTKALQDLLALTSSRFLASDVFNLLQQPIISRKFGLKEADLNQIHDWVHESGIRWGVDANHRSQIGLPQSERYSFRDGLHRLFLGYAVPSDVEMPFINRLPVGNPEGSQANALGSFWHFMIRLEDLRVRFQVQQTPEQWLQTLTEIAQQFMQPDNNELDDLRDTQQKVRALCYSMQQGCGRHPVDLDVMQKALADHLNNAAGAAIPTGMVTFASMNSMRNLPYRMICIIGLNDGAFPGAQRPAEFDLMAKPGRVRTGDRQHREDERNLFLDLLLATRERLYLSYTGRSVRDNEKMPPSVLISDLLDYVLPAIALGRGEAEKRLIIEHPLQPFSLQSYLKSSDNRIKSSRKEYFEGLSAKKETRNQTQPEILADGFGDEGEEELAAEYAKLFFTEALPRQDDLSREVSLEQLVQFFRNPSRYLLRHRLGIRFPEQPEELQDDEPFLPEWEERSTLVERLLPDILQGASFADIESSARAGNEYPPGKLGDALLKQEVRAMFDYANNLQAITAQPPIPSISQTLVFEIERENWQLRGYFNELRPNGLMCHRFDETRPVDYLSGWIQHLFLNAVAPEGVEKKTLWHSRNGQYRLMPVSNAKEELRRLLELYRQGLSKSLHFYPKSSWAYVTGKDSLKAAGAKWKNSRNEDFGEEKQPDFKQAMRGVANPLDSEFEACAKQVFAPLLLHIEDNRLKISKEAKE